MDEVKGHKQASAENPGMEATKEGATRPAECPKNNEREKEAPTVLLLKIADKLRQKGHDYYNKNEKDKTAIFWELESICRELAEERSER